MQESTTNETSTEKPCSQRCQPRHCRHSTYGKSSGNCRRSRSHRFNRWRL
ncbi:hypothetical protein [Rhizobium giardinii]